MTPTPEEFSVPQEFIKAAIDEIITLGYYRTEPRIELEIDDNTISFISTSNIVPIGTEAEISAPRVSPAEGLRSLEQTYSINGIRVSKTFDLKVAAKDEFFVRFERTSDAVKRITDRHQWISPVTKFTVIFKYGRNSHTCGVGKLLMGRGGLEMTRSKPGYAKYEYPDASFSGQGFSWYVEWT